MCSPSVPGPPSAGRGSEAGSAGSGAAPRPSGPGSAGAPPSLDPRNAGDLETNEHLSESDPYVRDRNSVGPCTSAIGAAVFGEATPERRHILAALRAAPDGPWAKRVCRMEGCCNVPAVGLTDAGAVGAVWFRCRDRLCPLCAHIRSRQVAERVQAATRQADSLRFMTLTLRSRDGSLREQLDSLYAGLKAFRRTAAWRAHVDGGVACVEVTWNARTRQWHPHLHLLVDGKYWAQASLSRAWGEITGDSTVVDIRAIRSRKQAASYVAKYASKPADLSTWPADAVQDYAAAMHRRRMILTFGTLHGAKVDADVEHEIAKVKDARVPLCQVESRSRLGCRRASLVLASLAKQSLAYARSLRSRSNSLYPVLADADTLASGSPADAARWLARHWDQDRSSFGCRLEPLEPPEPEPNPPGRRCSPKDTPPIDSAWLERDTRHV